MAYQGGPQQFEPQPRQSGWKALFRVITEPAATFAEFEGRVPVVPGYLAQMLLGLIGFLMAAPAAMRLLERTYAATPTIAPDAISVMKWVAIIFAGGITLAGPWLAGLIVSLLAMFYGQFQETRVGFPSYLGLIGYARLPLALGSILAGVLALALGDRAQGFSLSLAALAPNSPTVLRAFLATINPFDAWYYALLAIGFGGVHKGRAAKGVALAVTLYVIYALWTIGTAALGTRLVPGM